MSSTLRLSIIVCLVTICLVKLSNASSLPPIIDLILRDESAAPPIDSEPTMFKGVNLAGADFGINNIPGTFGTDYTYPNQSEVDYFMGKGMNTFRLPFRWERLQQSLQGPLDTDELSRLLSFVTASTAKGATIILDPHNYSRYNNAVIGETNSGVSQNDFADFWTRLATVFKGNDNVIFGIMNEPNDMSTELWLDNANVAIAAIRATGAQNWLLVPGNGYSGAHSWYQDYYGTPNADVMLGIVDSADKFYIEAHQYFDANSSGIYNDDCVNAAVGSQRLEDFTGWLKEHDLKGFLGEVGIINTPNCNGAITNALQHMQDNDDVWVGWTYWAAGPWWGDYALSIEPNDDGSDKAIMSQLTPFLP